ncbi:MAG: hypothetical protein RBR28_04070 [Lentimicrobium sp.]|jgi:hypothetical protein|nr:hypothetical protein [Lentimicrobium sp.]
MKKLFLFLMVLACCNTALIAQRIEIIPYPDAVSIALDGEGEMYLSNADAATLKEYFAAKFDPDKIIPIQDGYFSGYRLCFNTQSCQPGSGLADWIQVLTIDEEAAFAWFHENTPELLSLPFEGLKRCVDEKTHNMSDYNRVVRKYRHLSTKMYPQTIAPDGMQTDELTASVQMTALKIKIAAEPIFVSLNSGGAGVSTSPGLHNQNFDPWEEWIKCFDELQGKSYVTLIEFNEPTITPF